MTQEEKELLRKDLCARLPYGVKAKVLNEDILRYDYSSKEGGFIKGIENINDGLFVIECKKDGYVLSYDEFKPYLLPLSSMTEDQYIEFIIASGWNCDITDIRRGKFPCISYIGLDYIYNTIDWFNKNHFDYRGLIKKGLAIDATGLNIYC